MASAEGYKADGLRAMRNRRGMPIRMLARRAGVARGTVYNAENGKPVGLALLIRMARELEVGLADISADAARDIEAVA